jgi:hypothetical protein
MQLYIEDGDAILFRDGDEEQLVYDGLRDTRARGIICELLNGAMLAHHDLNAYRRRYTIVRRQRNELFQRWREYRRKERQSVEGLSSET